MERRRGGGQEHTRRVLALLAADGGVDDEELAARFDLDQVMRWMVLNSVLQNADSVDEAFLFAWLDDHGSGRIGIAGWDYDDLQEPPAHPANVLDDPLCWAAETLLEKRILRAPALRQRYREVLLETLQHSLTEGALRRALDANCELLGVVAPSGHRLRLLEAATFGRDLLRRRMHLLAEAAH